MTVSERNAIASTMSNTMMAQYQKAHLSPSHNGICVFYSDEGRIDCTGQITDLTHMSHPDQLVTLFSLLDLNSADSLISVPSIRKCIGGERLAKEDRVGLVTCILQAYGVQTKTHNIGVIAQSPQIEMLIAYGRFEPMHHLRNDRTVYREVVLANPSPLLRLLGHSMAHGNLKNMSLAQQALVEAVPQNSGEINDQR